LLLDRVNCSVIAVKPTQSGGDTGEGNDRGEQ
jgi:hypothetical protein